MTKWIENNNLKYTTSPIKGTQQWDPFLIKVNNWGTKEMYQLVIPIFWNIIHKNNVSVCVLWNCITCQWSVCIFVAPFWFLWLGDWIICEPQVISLQQNLRCISLHSLIVDVAQLLEEEFGLPIRGITTKVFTHDADSRMIILLDTLPPEYTHHKKYHELSFYDW